MKIQRDLDFIWNISFLFGHWQDYNDVGVLHWLLSVSFFVSSEICTPRPSSPGGLPEEDSVLFNKLTYLGCMKVSSPRNEVEALRAMATMKSSSQYPFPVTLYVPNVPEGSVR